MGFFLKEITHTIALHPQFFGPQMRNYLTKRLYEEVEGTCSGRFGYIISVIQIRDIGSGTLQSTTGHAEFKITYQAVVFKPFKNQVLDGIVSTVNKIGFWAEVGPLQIFVSQHLIPSYLKFDPSANPPAYISDNEENLEYDNMKIEKGSCVRIKIVGTRIDASEIFAIGTIKEDYLGPLSDTLGFSQVI